MTIKCIAMTEIHVPKRMNPDPLGGPRGGAQQIVVKIMRENAITVLEMFLKIK